MPKDFDPEDPNELVGVAIPGGDPEHALNGMVQEYLLMGWTAQQIMTLFRSPHYGATHQIYREMGEAHVSKRVRDLAGQWNQGWLKSREPNQPMGDERNA